MAVKEGVFQTKAHMVPNRNRVFRPENGREIMAKICLQGGLPRSIDLVMVETDHEDAECRMAKPPLHLPDSSGTVIIISLLVQGIFVVAGSKHRRAELERSVEFKTIS